MQTESQSTDQISKVPQPPRLEKPVRITEQVWPEGTVPVVSVFCITYNHARFVRDTIRGFLMQETTFPVEIFIHDDASTDGTSQILREYRAKYPRLLRTVLQAENQYSKNKFRFFFDYLSQQRGEFIATCEGDDYWTNPHKLQNQVEALEVNQNASLCYHRFEVCHVDSATPNELSLDQAVRSVADLLGNSGVQTATMLWRRAALPAMPSWFNEVGYGDIPLQLMLAEAGSLIYLKGVWSVYRKHRSGLSSQAPRRDMVSTLADIAERFDQHTGGRHRRSITQRVLQLNLWGAGGALANSDLQSFYWHRENISKLLLKDCALTGWSNECDRLLLSHHLTAVFACRGLTSKWVAFGNAVRVWVRNPFSHGLHCIKFITARINRCFRHGGQHQHS